jgi:hypothetical protein
MLAPRFLASAPLGLTGANPILAASFNLPSISPNNALPFFPVMGELELQNIEVTIGEAACSESTTIWDTGAAKNMTNKIEDLEPSSIEKARYKISGSNGTHHTSIKGLWRLSVETYGDQPEHNGYGVLNLPDTILNERCAFKLVAACEVKRTHGVSLSLPANGDAFVQFKNGARTKLLGDRVLLVPCADMSDIRATQLLNAQATFESDNGVMRGKHTSISHVNHDFLHSTFGHLPNKRLRHLHEVCSDVPPAWATLLRDRVCDHCLRADAIGLPPSGHLPRDDGLVCMDIWYTRVAFIHGGMHYVLGFTHFASGAKKSYRIKHKSDAPTAIRAAITWFNTSLSKRDLRVTWLHSDNAHELTKSEEIRKIREHEKLRITTIAAGNPRANPQERTFRTMAAGTRAYLLQLEGPVHSRTQKESIAKFWGYAWEEYEQVLNICPTADDPTVSPLQRLSGEKQPAAARRPFGCLMYINDTEVGDKVTGGKTTAERALHLGYNHEQIQGPPQLLTASHSYIGYCPSLRERIWVGTDCRFITGCFPGLRTLKQGGHENDYIPSPNEAHDLEQPKDQVKTAEAAEDFFDGETVHNWLDDAPSDDEVGEEQQEDDEGDTLNSPDPAPAPNVIEVLYDSDGLYYRARVHKSWQLKTTREWRHSVVWEGTSEEGNAWKPQVLNLNQEQWRLADHRAGGVPEPIPPAPTGPTEPSPPSPLRPLPATEPEPHTQLRQDKVRTRIPIPTPPSPPEKAPSPPPTQPSPPEKAAPSPPPTPERVPPSPRPIDEQSIGARVAARRRGITVGAAQVEVVQAAIEYAEQAVKATIGASIAEQLNELEIHALIAAAESDKAVDGSPHQKKARRDYAAIVAYAALRGEYIPPFEALTTKVLDGELVTMAAAFESAEGQLLLAMDDNNETFFEALAAVKSKAGMVTYREQLRSPRAKEWYDARVTEINKLKSSGAVESVRLDDPRVLDYLANGEQVINTMMIGNVKRDDKHNEIRLNNRCVVLGNEMTSVSDNEKTSPTVRCEGVKCCEANKVLRGQDEICFDYEGAYLQGIPRRLLIVRPPAGHREVDEDGTGMLWLLHAPLYGQADAGLAWNETINAFATSEQGCGMTRCDADPGIYSKRAGKDGRENVTMNLYVDDGKLYSDPTPAGKAERDHIRDKLTKRFKVKFQEENQRDTHLLSANIFRHSPAWSSVGLRTYIERQAKEHLPKPLDSYPVSWGNNPCSKQLLVDYEAALNKTEVLTGTEAERFGTLVGVLQFATLYRCDVSYPVGVGGRCRTFPTARMMEHMERVLVYLGRTASLATNYVATHPDSRCLRGRSDSDWSVRRSTTGYVITLAMGAVAHGSRRQHCIAMSSTEAEMMALAELALELLYVRDVLGHIGFQFEGGSVPEAVTSDPEAHRLIHAVGELVHGPIEVGVDNKGAYDLCHRTTTGKNSRHVERKVWKMRELHALDVVKLVLVPTEDMCADMLTKPLDDKTFHKHRKECMNLL